MYIQPFSAIGKESAGQVGGKAASLGELTQANFPVPPGFAITAGAFKDFRHERFPDEFIQEIMNHFDQLSTDLVSVRSSALAEDSADASWAGQMETYLNVGKENLLQRVRDCWDSIDSERAKVYAKQNEANPEDLMVGVVVQKMIDSEVAGVMFTVNPVSGDTTQILIEAAYGLGEGVVSGTITPDSYTVNRTNMMISDKDVHTQTQKIAFDNGHTQMMPVASFQENVQKLDDEFIDSLAGIGLRIEKHYGSPQDIEWAMVGGEIFILQSRPITTKALDRVTVLNKAGADPIVKGIGASQGIATGRVRIIKHKQDINDVVSGEILVTHTTTPDYVEAFQKIAGIITEIGGATNHAAVVSREMGIPAVVGTKDITTRVKTGDIVTIDGFGGLVYPGEVTLEQLSDEVSFEVPTPSGDDIQDMVDSIVAVINNSNELWPMGPMQLMPYIESDQSVDMFNKVKQLIESGMSDVEIASLFERPIFIKNFLLNTGIVGIKSANIHEKRVSLKDQTDFINLMLRFAKILNHNDPNYIVSQNLLWDTSQVSEFEETTKWDIVTPEMVSALGVLSVNLLALNWSLHWNYFAETGHELHGPYRLKGFSPKSRLVVKDYFNLSSNEVWSDGRKFPYSNVQLAQVYDTDNMYISFGIRMSGMASASNNTHFALFIDGERVSDVNKIIDIANEAKIIANIQTKYVNGLDALEKVRKGAKISYFARKKFYSYFGSEWYPDEVVEATINALGRKFVDNHANLKPLSYADKKIKFDPRNEEFPESY